MAKENTATHSIDILVHIEVKKTWLAALNTLVRLCTVLLGGYFLMCLYGYTRMNYFDCCSA